MRSDSLSLSDLKQIDRISSEFESEIRRGKDLSFGPWVERVEVPLREALVEELFAMTCEFLREQGVVDPAQRIAKANPEHHDFLLQLRDESSFAEEGSSSHVLVARCPACQQEIQFFSDSDNEIIACTDCDHEFSIRSDSRSIDAGIHIGQYQLLSRVGMGSFGTVWKARDVKLRRTVALKIPRRPVLNGQIASIERLEAQAVARLDHPNIVTVHTIEQDRGTPVIVEEFIDGINLKQWLRKRKPDLRAIASVVKEISDALQCAHDSGVIHRDLKPSNIMIDRDGRPVIVDFGLAKDSLNREDEQTQPPEVMGTFAYMAPEQAAGSPSLDRRCDIFSLGVILYELTTGTRPFGGSIDALREQIASRDPNSPREYNFRISRDLETIILCCLQKSPAKRYQHARELSDELERYLNGQPILARPITVAERTLRLAMRNKTVSSLGVALAMVLITGTCVSVFFALNAESNRRLASTRAELAESALHQERTIRNLLISFFRSPEPGMDGYAVTVATMLDRSEDRVRRELRDSPYSLAVVLNALGKSRLGMGMYQEGYENLLLAGALFEKTLGPDDEETLRNQFSIAGALTKINRMPEAIELHREILQARIKFLGPADRDTLDSQNCLASALVANGDLEEGIRLHEKTLAAFESASPREALKIVASKNNLAVAFRKQKRYDEALALQESACELLEHHIGSSHPDALIAARNLIKDYVQCERLDEAVAIGLRALETHRERYAQDHPVFSDTAVLVARLCFQSDRQEQALQVIDEMGESGGLRVLESQDPQALISAAESSFRKRDFRRSRLLAQYAYDFAKTSLGPQNRRTLHARTILGASYSGLGLPAEAIKVYEGTLKDMRDTRDQPSEMLANTERNLAFAYYRSRQYAEAAPHFRSAIEIRTELYERTDPRLIELLRPMAVSLVLTSQYADAIGWFDRLEQHFKGREQGNPLFPNVWIGLAYCHSRLGAPADAARYYGKAADEFERTAREGKRGLDAWCNALTASAAAGRTESIRQLAKKLLGQFGETQNPTIAERLAHVLVPYPETCKDFGEPIFELAQTASRGTIEPERLIAASHYRRGEFALAEKAFADSAAFGHQPRVWDLAFRSMSSAQLGNLPRAKELLLEAEALPIDRLHWIERVESLALLDEARKLVMSKARSVQEIDKDS
ncbi:MAG: serine/threonine-protein kinase [Planctomycetota bacterium]